MKNANIPLMLLTLVLFGCDASMSNTAPAEAVLAGGAQKPEAASTSGHKSSADIKEHAMSEKATKEEDEKAELLKAVGGECADSATGKSCFAGDYDLELIPGCDNDGFFAGVSGENGALLVDRAPPDDTVKIATLSKGQFVCIEAIASASDKSFYYYVTTIPVSEVDDCDGNQLCETYGDRQVRWHVDEATFKGRRAGSASGWADAKDLDVFSNGLKP